MPRACGGRPDAYETRTFTIAISPLLAQTTKFESKVADYIDRTITLSSKTIFFLQQQGISLQHMLEGGVPYLCRDELRRATEYLVHRDASWREIDLTHLKPDEAQVCQELRATLAAWVASGPKKGSILEIPEPRGGMLRKSTAPLMRQIVQDEFPQCRCWTHAQGWVIKVTLRDAQRDQEVKQREATDKQLALAKQYGLSWILEAMVGGSRLAENEELVRTTAAMLATNQSESHVESPADSHDESDIRQWQQALTKLQQKRSVVVGHNVIYDVAFIYAMLMGNLPQSLDEFRTSVRALFPRIIDTKLLVSQIIDADVVDQPLEHFYAELQTQVYPFVRTAEPGWGFTRYSSGIGANRGSAHNAGFDSYMTAMLFLKTACKRMRLQRRLQPDTAQTRHIVETHSWHGLVDEELCGADKFLRRHEIRLPDFESDFWTPVRNRLRLSTAGIINLES